MIQTRLLYEKRKMAKTFENLRRLGYVYIEGRVSLDTLLIVTEPLENRSDQERELLASKIMDLIEASSTEKDLIAQFREKSPNWLKETGHSFES